MAVCPEPRRGRKAGRDPGERTTPFLLGTGHPSEFLRLAAVGLPAFEPQAPHI